MPTYVNSKIYHKNGSNIKIIDQSVIEENSGWLRDELNRLWAAIENNTPQVQPSASIPTSISRPKNTTASSISWTGGLLSASSVNSGGTLTLTKGTVTATYGNSNGTGTITTANFTNNPTITSSDSTIVSIGTIVKNGNTPITGLKPGTVTIIVKDGDTVVKTTTVTVSNASNTANITSSAKFNASQGTISGTTVTAPTVTTDTVVTISVSHDGKIASTTLTYTAKYVQTTTYYWYVGTTKPTSLSQASTVTSYPDEQTYTNNSGAKSHIFALTNSNKNVTFINLATGNPIDQNEVDTTTISGYKIFETAVGTANTGTIKIRIS